VRRWIVLAAALLGAALVFAALRERTPGAPPDEPEIDEASKRALREILKQEDE
jgi:hypothetical protein